LRDVEVGKSQKTCVLEAGPPCLSVPVRRAAATLNWLGIKPCSLPLSAMTNAYAEALFHTAK